MPSVESAGKTSAAIGWTSKSQSIPFDSTAATESVAIHMGAKQALNLCPAVARVQDTSRVGNDKSSALRNCRRGDAGALASISRVARLKFVLVGALNGRSIIALTKVPTEKDRSDFLTKMLAGLKFLRARVINGRPAGEGLVGYGSIGV